MATFLYSLRRTWLYAKCAGLLVLLMAALGLRSCTEPAPCRPGISSLLPVAQAAVLPASAKVYVHQSIQLDADTLRPGARPDLRRKMLPQARWRYSGGYLVYPRPRRPRQGALDSAAAAARRPAHE